MPRHVTDGHFTVESCFNTLEIGFEGVDICGNARHPFVMEDILDARGLMCPLPVLKLGKVMRGVPVGTVVTVWADDPIAVIDIPHFCVEAGHKLISQTDEGPYQIYVLERLPK